MTKATGFGKALPKNFKKATRGYDQAFTLPKGTSAAPIKQATSYKPKMKFGKADAFVHGAATGVALTIAQRKKFKPSKGKNKRPTGGWRP